MGCQSEAYLGDNLTFTVTTHDIDTGELTDADAAPIWRLYEDEIPVPLATGTMDLLDPINTTGFYSELIACTAANGFEVDRSYNVYIVATIDGVTGGLSYGFTILEPLLELTAKLIVIEEDILNIALAEEDILNMAIAEADLLILTVMDDP